MVIDWDNVGDYYKDKLVIYKITNSINGKIYIGQTNNIKRRIRRHKNEIKSSNSLLYKAIRKYGIRSFDICIVCECKSRESLNEMEYHFIKQYKSREYENGYNLTDGGDGTIGYVITDGHRYNLSKSLKNRVFDDSHKQKISESKRINYKKENHPNYGKTLSDKVKQRISESHKGKVISDETKQKISYWNRNIKDRTFYKITTPEGCDIITSFVSDFCKDNGLVYSCMMKVSRGERKHHKGYTISKIINDKDSE